MLLHPATKDSRPSSVSKRNPLVRDLKRSPQSALLVPQPPSPRDQKSRLRTPKHPHQLNIDPWPCDVEKESSFCICVDVFIGRNEAELVTMLHAVVVSETLIMCRTIIHQFIIGARGPLFAFLIALGFVPDCAWVCSHVCS
jgi:hypothetical protein